MKQEVDEATAKNPCHHRHKEDLHPQIIMSDDKAKLWRTIRFLRRARCRQRERQDCARHAHRQDAAQTAKTRDITGGLPRCGIVRARARKTRRKSPRLTASRTLVERARKRCVLITIGDEAVGRHLIPIGKHVIVFKATCQERPAAHEGRWTRTKFWTFAAAGIAGTFGQRSAEVYRLQGVTINDKHIEIIVRQMLRKIRVTEPATPFLGRTVDKLEFEAENEASRRRVASRRKPCRCCSASQGVARNRQLPQCGPFQDTTPSHEPPRVQD